RGYKIINDTTFYSLIDYPRDMLGGSGNIPNTDFAVMNDSTFIFSENYNTLYLYYRDSTKFRKSYSTIFYSLLGLSNDKFALAGSKNGNCWYAILDKSGNILEEHELVNRMGSFRSITLNKDGSLLLLGSLYKNSFQGIANKGYDEKMSPITLGNNIGLYLCKAVTNITLDTQEFMNSETDLFLFPNPGTDFIEITKPYEGLKPSEGYSNSIRIFNVLGEEIIKISDSNISQFSIPNSQLRINVSSLPTGIYFVRVGSKVSKFLKI
ncbi:MAG: T9SS type A sorting domain-containing protein, partial [Ignavibacteria bacterium]|nr:T9SS type A sorting domain-containing protein [Ignavibacteria bacterium]